MAKLVDLIRKAYGGCTTALNLLQGPLLLAIRLYWGWQFAQDGWGKLTHLDRVTQFFLSLGLPGAGLAALIVALVELCGGTLFALGVASRLTSLVLFVNMTMAYLSVPDDRASFFHLLSKPDDFYGATPYTYWFAALLILILGPGVFAVDWVIGRRFALHPKSGKNILDAPCTIGADPGVLAGLRQNLRLKVGYEEEKIDLLIELERERLPAAPLQTLMEAAIERWERDNR